MFGILIIPQEAVHSVLGEILSGGETSWTRQLALRLTADSISMGY
jgi:hypothetical protein